MNAAPPPGGNAGTSTRPYLIRALHEWCTDNGFTPYIAVHVDASVQVPMEYVKNHEIVLNVGFEATSGMKLGNEHIEFKARFGGSSRSIQVPVDHVIAIYARENGQGMAFPMPTDPPTAAGPEAAPAEPAPGMRSGGLRLASDESAGADDAGADGDGDNDDKPPPDASPPGAPRPALKRVK